MAVGTEPSALLRPERRLRVLGRQLLAPCPVVSTAGQNAVDDAAKPGDRPLVLLSCVGGIATIQMNRPERFNAWTREMMAAFQAAFTQCSRDDSVRAVIFTGIGKYYCSGVDFGGSFGLMRPSTMVAEARDTNQALFEAFLDFPKPLFAAVNGQALGASVTSAALCDAIIAAPEASFQTPFRALGIVPEGCSSINFPRLMGADNAKVFLEEGRNVRASEALQMGLVQEVVDSEDQLLVRAHAFAEAWVAAGRGRRHSQDPDWAEALRRANREESVALANSFLGRPFLENQYKFAASRKKTGPQLVFWLLKTFQPLLALSKL